MPKNNRPLIRTESLRFRASEEEKKLIDERAEANNMTKTEYIMELVKIESEGGILFKEGK